MNLKEIFSFFQYAKSIVGNRIYIGLGLNVLSGVLDGLGIALLMPVLSAFSTSSEAEAYDLGPFSFLSKFYSFLGLEININILLISIAIMFILKNAILYLNKIYMLKLQLRFIMLVRINCTDALSKLSFVDFLKTDSGVIQNTLTSESVRLVQAFTTYMGAIQNGLIVAVYIALAMYANIQFSALLIIFGGLSSLIFYSVNKLTTRYSHEVTKKNHTYQGYLIQAVAAFKYLKSTGKSREYFSYLKKHIREIEATNRRIGEIKAILVSVREPVVILLVIGVVLIQLNFFQSDLGLIILSLMFFYRAMNFLLVLQGQWNNYLSFSGAYKNLTEFYNELRNKEEPNGSVELSTLNGELEMQEVSFSFDGKIDVLRDINLIIKKNETIAFVGKSGSGKTTLANLIVSLLVPTTGNYKINGINVGEINKERWRRLVGYISQDSVVFDDTIFNNVTFWSEKNEHNLARFWDALKQASIEVDVKSMTNKEDTILGSEGVELSGGQRQRISIAREIFKDPEILVLDEATSALDSETEDAIKKNIDLLHGHKTIIIIAHRLSTIKNADRIIFLSEGKIEDEGTFKELTAKNVVFRKLVELQEL